MKIFKLRNFKAILALVTITAIFLSSCGTLKLSREGSDNYKDYELVDGSHTIVNLQNINNLQIDIVNATTNFYASDELKVELVNKNEERNVRYLVEGDTLKLGEEGDQEFGIEGLQIDFSDENFNEIHIYMPEKDFNSVDISSLMTDIEIENLNANSITVGTLLSNISGKYIGNNIYAETMSGNISGQFVASEADISTLNGNIYLREFNLLEESDFNYVVETMSGDVNITGLDDISDINVTIDTLSGEATFNGEKLKDYNPATKTNKYLEIATLNGDITIN